MLRVITFVLVSLFSLNVSAGTTTIEVPHDTLNAAISKKFVKECIDSLNHKERYTYKIHAKLMWVEYDFPETNHYSYKEVLDVAVKWAYTDAIGRQSEKRLACRFSANDGVQHVFGDSKNGLYIARWVTQREWDRWSTYTPNE